MVSLRETLISATDYNDLPYVGDLGDVHHQHAAELAELQALLAEHDMPAGVSIRLIHKHFDAKEGEVFVLKERAVDGFGRVLVMRPTSASTARNLRGVNFFVDSNGSLQAYEYTDAKVPNLALDYAAFFTQFSEYILNHGLQHKFGLKLPTDWTIESWSEYELPHERSTIIIPAGLPEPQKTGLGFSLQTEWNHGCHEHKQETSKSSICVMHSKTTVCNGHTKTPNDSHSRWLLGGEELEVGTPLHSLVTGLVEVW